jgi:hypothetical protein
MRRLAVLVAGFALLAGCGDRRTFDERYADAQSNIDARAANLDAQLNEAQDENASRK